MNKEEILEFIGFQIQENTGFQRFIKNDEEE